MKPSTKHTTIAFIVWLCSLTALYFKHKELALKSIGVFLLYISIGHAIIGLIMMYLQNKDKYK